MSRYSKKVIGEHGITLAVVYGHDHASGYFVQVYHEIRDDPLAKIDGVFGELWHEDETILKMNFTNIFNAAILLARSTIERLRSGELPTERMDVNAKTHLGARLAKDFRDSQGLPDPD